MFRAKKRYPQGHKNCWYKAYLYVQRQRQRETQSESEGERDGGM